MSTPASPTKRRPVPPPKTPSQARLRDGLTSPSRERGDSWGEDASTYRTGSGLSDAETRKQEAMKHLTLPPGWDLRNEVDVTYHTHVAKPVVHETVYRQTTELIEPKIERDIHRHHQYDYIQPLEAEIPQDCYATNANGEVIHAPGGLSTQAGQDSYWEQGRQDRGYGLTKTLNEGKHGDKAGGELERDTTKGPFPIEAEGGGEGVLQRIQDGRIAQRLGGAVTSASTTSPPNHATTPLEQPQARPSGDGFQHSSLSHRPQRSREVDALAPNDSLDSPKQDPSATHTSPGTSPDLMATLDQEFDRISLQQRHPQAKPLPPLPDTSQRSTVSGSGVRRVSGDNKLRDRYGLDSGPASVEKQHPVMDDETAPDRA